MKSNGTLKLIVQSFALVLLLLISKFGIAQPDYDFRNPVLVSGTDKQVGAVYLFSNVRTGTDAFVTLTALVGGATIYVIDETGTGYEEAFQPRIYIPGPGEAYAQFNISFVIAGTNTPMLQSKVPITPLDVDGMSFLNEFERVEMINGYHNYDMMGNQMVVSELGGWIEGRNIGDVDYPGVDTSAKVVMFSVVNKDVTSLSVRFGAVNTGTSTELRRRSLYFQEFFYNNGLLPLFGLLSFNGVKQGNKTVLSWELAANCSFSNITIERSTDGKSYTPIANITVEYSSGGTKQNFTDYFSSEGNLYYRLKITQPGSKYNYSNVLLLKGKSSSLKGFKIYPNIISTDANINLDAERKQQGILLISDYSGRIVKQQQLNLQEGNNTLQLNNLDRLPAGNYIAVIRISDAVYNQKITIR
jgi:hypothetical protein